MACGYGVIGADAERSGFSGSLLATAGKTARNAVGFYWTLPVPWAGFTHLPDAVEAAAKASQTIRSQCEAQQAVLLFVDLSRGQGWRSHGPLSDRAQKARIDINPVFPT